MAAAHTPRPTRGGSGEPQPDFSADQLERGFQPRRAVEHAEAEGDRIHVRLARQLVHEASIANTLLFGPTPRQKPVVTAGGSARTYSTCMFGMS